MKRPPWLVLRVVAVLFVVAGTLGSYFGGFGSPFGAIDLHPAPIVALLLLALSGVAIARTRPAVGFLTTAGAVAGYVACGFLPSPIYLTVPAAAAVAATRRQPRELAPSLVVGLSAVVVAAVVSDTELGGAEGRAFGIVGLGVAAATITWFTRSRKDFRTERVRGTAIEERLRMAQDLHDGVGHGLAVIAMQAGVALHVLDRDPVGVRQALEAIRDTSRESLDALRVELSALSGDTTPRGPGRGLSDLPGLVERIASPGIIVNLELGVAPGAVSQAAGATAYGIVQEALTNVLRHSGATGAQVVVRLRESALEIDVTDNGRGPTAGADAGMGIDGMRRRAQTLGGTVTTGPGPEGGYAVRARIPVGVRIP